MEDQAVSTASRFHSWLGDTSQCWAACSNPVRPVSLPPLSTLPQLAHRPTLTPAHPPPCLGQLAQRRRGENVPDRVIQAGAVGIAPEALFRRHTSIRAAHAANMCRYTFLFIGDKYNKYHACNHKLYFI